jgi:hypothetical protein
MLCSSCGQGMRRINPEPETWMRWTALFWCAACHRFSFGQRDQASDDRQLNLATPRFGGRATSAQSG